jgi:hypothetical protein
MRPDQYTAENVAAAMGVSFDPGPIDSGWLTRIVLKPSFHPELCITVVRTDDSARAVVHVLFEQLSLYPTPYRFGPCSKDSSTINVTIAQDLFERVVERAERPGRSVVIDGMPYDAIVRTPAQVVRCDGNASVEPLVRDALKELIPVLHRNMKTVCVRNALARAAAYVGCQLEVVPSLPQAPSIHMVVLGAPEDRLALLAALARKNRISD